MSKIKLLLFSGLFLILVFGCRDEFEVDKFKRPDWLTGKIYTQILEEEELTIFAKCLELTGYDTIINTSGSYTVFAPSNDAFSNYFQSNTSYNSVDNIPAAKLNELVKAHIVQNAWTKKQLRSLDVNGWIDPLDSLNNKPRGFKRQTLLLDNNRKYGVVRNPDSRIESTVNEDLIIVDTLNTSWHRRVFTDSRKYVPFFYKEYFDIYSLETDDYSFYFNRPIQSSNDIYIANSRITTDGIFAENGFIYIIDEVIEPLKNIYEIMEEEETNESYSEFLDLVNNFPDFEYNSERTFRQPGASQGLRVDSLFDLTYPELVFDINNEKTKAPRGVENLPSEVTIRYHHGFMAPSNRAFEDFIENYINIPNGWGSLSNTPKHIKRFIVNSHMAINLVYPSDFKRGFYNGELDIVRLDENNIVDKKFGSNGTFIGLDNAIVPRAFKSITGPIYLNRGFSTVMNAIEKTNLLTALKRENRNYMFFVERDSKLSIDSSLIYNALEERFSGFMIGDSSSTEARFTIDDIRVLLFNHVATQRARGLARKEFIPNLAGNYLIFNNENGEVSGTAQTTEGFMGSDYANEIPKLISRDSDNGDTYEINNWFSFSVANLYVKIQTEYPHFFDLLKKAGLVDHQFFRFSFISDSENYTFFIPSIEALETIDLSSWSQEELRQFLLMHVIQGELIFTDGNKTPGYYKTLRIDEKSTSFSKVFTQIFIEPGIDYIRFKEKNGSAYTDIEESDRTNKLTGLVLSEGVIRNTRNNATIHEIDKPLIYSQVEVR